MASLPSCSDGAVRTSRTRKRLRDLDNPKFQHSSNKRLKIILNYGPASDTQSSTLASQSQPVATVESLKAKYFGVPVIPRQPHERMSSEEAALIRATYFQLMFESQKTSILEDEPDDYTLIELPFIQLAWRQLATEDQEPALGLIERALYTQGIFSSPSTVACIEERRDRKLKLVAKIEEAILALVKNSYSTISKHVKTNTSPCNKTPIWQKDAHFMRRSQDGKKIVLVKWLKELVKAVKDLRRHPNKYIVLLAQGCFFVPHEPARTAREATIIELATYLCDGLVHTAARLQRKLYGESSEVAWGLYFSVLDRI